jgi:ribosomal 50S subunit-recycling heat shock protein
VPEESASPAAASEAAATAVQEFEKEGASNFASQPDASEVLEGAAVQSAETVVQTAAEVLPSDVAPIAETKSENTVEVVPPPHHAEPEATTAEVAKEDTPAPQEQKSEEQIGEEVTGEMRRAEAQEQFVPDDLKSVEPVQETTAVVHAGEESAAESLAKSGDTPDSNSPEPVSETVTNQAAEPAFTRAGFSEATTPATSSQPAVGGMKDMAKKESEISETTAAAWANWRRIRESGESKSATAPPTSPKSHLPEPASANSAEEKNTAPPEAAMAVAAGAEMSPEESSAAPEDSGEIASIVDSVLAQMRPQIVEEISRKLGKKK